MGSPTRAGEPQQRDAGQRTRLCGVAGHPSGERVRRVHHGAHPGGAQVLRQSVDPTEATYQGRRTAARLPGASGHRLDRLETGSRERSGQFPRLSGATQQQDSHHHTLLERR